MKGKRILVLRPAGRSDGMVAALEKRQAIPIAVPAVAIVPLEDPSRLDATLRNLESNDWVAFTSVAGVEAFSSRMGILGLELPKGKPRFAAIGPATAKALRALDIEDVWVPSKFATASLGRELPGSGRVLLLRTDTADTRLDETLAERGFDVERLDAYRSVPLHWEPIRDALESGVDAVALTSASIAVTFADAVAGISLGDGPAICCIGPPTAEACKMKGLQVAVVAEVHTAAGLIDAMENYFKEEGRGAGKSRGF